MLSKVITISQQKGGTGKTTLAVHLAMAFIKYHNLKVALIDTDPQGSLGKWFMIRTEKKVSNENLTFKTASLWGAQYESKTLKKDNDIVIIDTPPKIESDARPSIEASDLVIIPNLMHHINNIDILLNQAKKILKKKGKIYIFEPMVRELHQIPEDYFRVTPFGFKFLLKKKKFKNFKIRYDGSISNCCRNIGSYSSDTFRVNCGHIASNFCSHFRICISNC